VSRCSACFSGTRIVPPQDRERQMNVEFSNHSKRPRHTACTVDEPTASTHYWSSIMRTKTLLSTLAVSAALLTGAAVLPASAQSSGTAQSLTDAQVQQKLAAAGYRSIEKIERRQDRVKVKAADRDGRRVELRLDPLTAEVTESEFKHHERSADRRGPAGEQRQEPRRG